MIHALNSDVRNAPRHFLRVTNDQPGGFVDRKIMYRYLVENNTLREDQTREIEEALTAVARRDLVAVADLINQRRPLAKGIGATTFEYDRVSPVGEATQSMSILNLGGRDLANFTRTAIPVPVTASQFQLDARQQAAGAGFGDPIDVTNVEEHTRSVAEKLEDTLVNGSSVVLGGNSLPGYTNLSARDQVSFSSAAWTSLTAGALSAAATDVAQMKANLRADGFGGPYTLYIPSNFDVVMDEDYNSQSGDRTLRERLLAIEGVRAVKVLPALPDSECLLVQMTRSVVEVGLGQDITTVTWDEMGGLQMNWAILAVMTFGLKVANARAPLQDGTLPTLTTAAGISHLS